MFKKFTNADLAIIAVALDEEEENRRNKQKKKKIWVHSVWKSRPVQGEFCTLFPHLMDDETKFYEYFRMMQQTGTEPHPVKN